MLVEFQTPEARFTGTLDRGAITNALAEAFPITSKIQRWGDEIYFEVPERMLNVEPTLDVEVGDIAYWPEGPCLCIFFGRTPASTSAAPRPASEVTVIGHTDVPAEVLRSIKAGTTVVVSHEDSGPH